MNVQIEYMDVAGDVHKEVLYLPSTLGVVQELQWRLRRGDTLLGVSRYLG